MRATKKRFKIIVIDEEYGALDMFETDAFRLEEARRCFEQIALGLLRPSDTLARYDTRRYVALLANRSPSEAEQLAAEVAEQFTKKAPLPLGLKFRVRGSDRPEPSGETAIKAE